MVLAGGGVAGAAEHAQPGDVLYGAKIVLEDARLWLTADDVAAGTRALAYAQDRLDEAAVASARGDHDGAALALRGAADRSHEAEVLILGSGEFEPLLQLSDALASQQDFLTGLLPQLSGSAVEAAHTLLDQVQAGRQNLGRALQGGSGTAVPPGDTENPAVPDAAPAPSAGATGVEAEPAPFQPGTPAAPPAPGPLPRPVRRSPRRALMTPARACRNPVRRRPRSCPRWTFPAPRSSKKACEILKVALELPMTSLAAPPVPSETSCKTSSPMTLTRA